MLEEQEIKIMSTAIIPEVLLSDDGINVLGHITLELMWWMHKSMPIHQDQSQHVKFTAYVLDREVLRLATAHYR